MNLFSKQKETHRHRKSICGYQREMGGGWVEAGDRDKLGVWD